MSYPRVEPWSIYNKRYTTVNEDPMGFIQEHRDGYHTASVRLWNHNNQYMPKNTSSEEEAVLLLMDRWLKELRSRMFFWFEWNEQWDAYGE